MYFICPAELRQRHVNSSPADGDADSLLKSQQEAQDQVAEEMLGLTKALREQTVAAGEIIRKDTAALESTSEMADKNASR